MAINYNFRKAKAKENAAKERLLRLYPTIRDVSGIYTLTRTDEEDFKYAYVGQAKHVLTRLAQHLVGFSQHIDLSLKKHGLGTEYGWRVHVAYCDESELDTKEREQIKVVAALGYQLRNKTAGGQDKGKFGIDENRPARGYRDGLAQGYKNAQKEVSHWFSKNLKAEINGKPTMPKQKTLDKFNDFIKGEDNDKTDKETAQDE